MKHHYLAGLALSGILGLTSCARHIYSPNAANAPLLKEKNEFKASISPYNLQAAFAVTNHIAIMANGQYVYKIATPDNDNNNTDNDLFTNQALRGGVVEGAIGFFQPLDPRKKMVLDVYAGGGAGGFRTLAPYSNNEQGLNREDYRLSNRFAKFFIQPSIGFVHPVVEAAFSSRFSFVNFYDSYIGPKAYANDATAKADFLKVAAKPTAFYEPAFTVRVGYKYVKFQSQLLFSVPLNDNLSNYDRMNDYFQQVVFTMGASINIAHWYDDFKKDRKRR
ncbi:hypothetical protein [Chitinophaga varians]|uniref:hypothetical protein n=1 Tax=Chitinophaga varians TaxID=2202339 RepID=UPI00165F039E|nr:hypothetical protein [Chitinophaga varians]MBC9912777.1 hypothetical protein [Chitinophaga varians]